MAIQIEKYINKNCKLKNRLCWQYVYMVNEEFTEEEIYKVCRKCIFNINFIKSTNGK